MVLTYYLELSFSSLSFKILWEYLRRYSILKRWPPQPVLVVISIDQCVVFKRGVKIHEKEERSLPVDERRSKTLLLKLPDLFNCSNVFCTIVVENRVTFPLGMKITDNNFKDAVFAVQVRGCPIVFSGSGVSLIWNSRLGILKQNQREIRYTKNNPRDYGIARNFGSGLRDWRTLLALESFK